MPAFSFSAPSKRRLLGIGVALAVFNASASATEVLVVTDSHHPVQARSGARLIELDAPARIEAELSAGLPLDPDRAAVLVRERLRQGEPSRQKRLVMAYQDVAEAWSLGVAKIPAVVVDRRYVVYGESNVARAVARIQAHRATRP